MSTTRRNFIGTALASVGALIVRAPSSLARRRKNRSHALYEDHFDRPDSPGWGRAWFNQRYERHWAIKSKKAVYHLPESAQKVYYRPCPIFVLDHDVSPIDLRTTISVSNVTARTGLAARAADYARYYTAYLGPEQVLRIARTGHHHEKLLARREFPFEPLRRYRMRMQVKGTEPVYIRAKVWPEEVEEPVGWALVAVDRSADALIGRGPFGIFAQHALDRQHTTIRVSEFVAHSGQKPSATRPSIAYSLVGPPAAASVKAVAKTSVPASVGFELGPEPTFTQGVQTVAPQPTGAHACTRKADLDLQGWPPSSIVYWRAFADRHGVKVVGDTGRFKMAPEPGLPVRFGFGACTKWQFSPRKSFEQARLKLVDFYLHQGDFGYARKHVVAHASDTYQDHWTRMLMDPHLAGLTRETPFGFYQDDEDYGNNQADRNTIRPFSIGAFDDMHANPGGPYFEFRYGDVAVFSIDCRRFSTGRKPPREKRSKLGTEQLGWLKTRMRQAADDDDVGLLVVASPQAFGSDASPASWHRHYPAEWTDLIDFFRDLNAPVLVVSGDAHGHRLHEYPQKNLDPGVPRIVEFVSAGTEHSRFSTFNEASVILRKANGMGFGLVELGPEQSIAGERVRSLTLTAVKTKDGTPFWTAQYTIVRDVGIFPLL